MLIQKGIKVNETQKDGSTPLHAASFYGHDTIVQLLIDYGADIHYKNNFGNFAYQEALNLNIANIITQSEEDKINSLFLKLKEKNLVSDIVLIKQKDQIVAKKLICSKDNLPRNIEALKSNWEHIWHGTKYQYLESIIKNGLRASGSILPNGEELKPLPGHIELSTEVAGIKNWAKAVFVSPSIFYSSHIAYAERITSKSKTYAVLVEGIVRPGTFTKHSSTVLKYAKKEGEPHNLEYKVPEK